MKKVNYTLFDNTEPLSYEYYLEDCEEADREPGSENSQKYWDWVSDMERMEYDDMLSNMKYSKQAMQPCIVTGRLGLWDGGHNIYPVRFENVRKAVEKCFGNCDYYKVKVTDGRIEISAYHHDGCNGYTISLLSKRGEKELNNGYNGYVEKEIKPYHTKLIDGYLF